MVNNFDLVGLIGFWETSGKHFSQFP